MKAALVYLANDCQEKRKTGRMTTDGAEYTLSTSFGEQEKLPLAYARCMIHLFGKRLDANLQFLPRDGSLSKFCNYMQT